MGPILSVLISFLPGTVSADTTGYNRPLCTDSLDIPLRPIVETDLVPGDVHVTAESADLETEGFSTLKGTVEITREEQQSRSDYADFNQLDNTSNLEGNVQYWDESIYLEADKAHLNFDTDIGAFESVRYTIKDNRGRGKSSNIDMIFDIESRLKNADYSTCDPAHKFWQLSTGELKLNHSEEWGSARNVVLKIKNVPVFYSPYVSFSLNDKRKTGFLTPGMGSSNRNGLEIRTPFYWNIAPHMDATLTPRILTDSGVMLAGKLRHLSKNSQSELKVEYLPGDNKFGNKNRNLLGLKHRLGFGRGGNFSLNYNRASDKEYFEDFGTSLDITSTRFLEQRADISYYGSWWNASVALQNYQSVDRTITAAGSPYKRLPQINFNVFTPEGNNKFNYSLASAFTYFDRSEDVTGSRLDLTPSISYSYKTASTFATPKVSLRYTQYSLRNTDTFESGPNRILPIISIDSGVSLERDFSLFGKKSLQTLEPGVFYLYVPQEGQNNLPVFDTGLYDFSFDSLFRVNRFSGNDRLGDANQFTLAITSRLIDQATGREASYLRFGQIYYLSDRKVILPGNSIRDDNISPIIAEIGTGLLDHWRFRGDLQWNPNTGKTEKLLAQIQYKPATKKVVNFGYRIRRTSSNLSGRTLNLTDIEQSDISFRWPIKQNWGLIGRWNHAIPEKKSLEIFGGVEYDRCCWSFRAVARRFLTDINGRFDTGVFLQVELKGLSGIGRKTADFLKQGIPGYESDL